MAEWDEPRLSCASACEYERVLHRGGLLVARLGSTFKLSLMSGPVPPRACRYVASSESWSLGQTS
jgi:hypothetical protein